MNRYSRVFHHISVEDVKRNVLKKYKENKNFLESIKNARKFLKDLNSPYYSDWRSNKLKEGMDTSNVFVTTFPSTGDSNLENIDANNGEFNPDGKALLGNYITNEELWACTSCNACVEACPISIDPLSIILEMRRYLVMEQSAAPMELNNMMSNIENNGAPWPYNQMDRLNWKNN